jgi:putative iron-regulated protein
MARPLALLVLALCLGLGPVAAEPAAKDASVKAISATDVLKTYADIAQAGHADALATAKTLKLAVDTLEENLRAARAAWIAARPAYMQTEAFRFGNAIVDDWPSSPKKIGSG